MSHFPVRLGGGIALLVQAFLLQFLWTPHNTLVGETPIFTSITISVFMTLLAVLGFVFLRPTGWIVAMLLLNFIPRIAIAVRHDPVKGFLALILDGFIAGIILGPIVYIAGMVATGHNLVLNAVLITALVFTAVTAMVWSSGKRYQAKRGLMTGIFVSLIGAIVLNMFMPMGILGLLISIGVGIMGVLILVYSTSDILHNPDIDSPIIGALMLFAGLFNVFTSILHILMAFAGGRD